MNEEIFKQILPEEHLSRYLANGVRPDGRKFLDIRNLKIIMNFIPTFDGCSILTLGETNIIFTVQSALIDKKISNSTATSLHKEENYNFLDIHIDIGKYEIEDGDIVERNKYESYLEKYCEGLFSTILREKIARLNEGLKNKCWFLQINAKILKNNGNLMTALYLGVFFALYSTEIATLVEGKQNVLNNKIKQKIGLKIDDFYYPITFSQLFSKYLITDPSYDEEIHSDFLITFLMNLKNDEYIMQKNSGKTIEYKKILELKKECDNILNSGIKTKILGFFGKPSQTLEIII